MTKTIFTLSLAFGVAAIMSAGAAHAQEGKYDAKHEALSKTHGYVVVVMPHVIGKSHPSVSLRNYPNGMNEQMLVPSESNFDVRHGWVKEGVYEIAEMDWHNKLKGTPVVVKAGTVTDLGGMTLATVSGEERMVFQLRHKDFAPLVAAVVEPVKKFLPGEPIIWTHSQPPTIVNVSSPKLPAPVLEELARYRAEKQLPALKERLRQAKNSEEFAKIYVTSAATILGEPSTDNAGALYAGSNFGQLRKRDAAGNWHAIDTGTISPLTAVEASAKAIMVGTYHGGLLVSADGAQTWRRLHNFDKRETVLSILFAADQYLVLTGKYGDSGPLTMASVQVYSIDQATLAQPKLVRKFDLPARTTYHLYPRLQATLAGKYYLVNTLAGVERFDLAAQTWKSLAMPHAVTHLRSPSSGAVITGFKAAGGFSKLSASHDFGETWTSLETPSYPVIDIQMESATAGFATRIDMGAFSSPLQVMEYDAASKSWKLVWTTPKSVCDRTVRDVKGREQFCVSPHGSIFRFGPGKLIPELVAD